MTITNTKPEQEHKMNEVRLGDPAITPDGAKGFVTQFLSPDRVVVACGTARANWSGLYETSEIIFPKVAAESVE